MEKNIKIITYNLGRGCYNEEYYKGQKKKMSVINKNVEQQINILKKIDADIILTQETNKLMLNRVGVNLFKMMEKRLKDYHSCYYANLNIANIINFGNATFSKEPMESYPIIVPFKIHNFKDDLYYRNKTSIVSKISVENKKLVIINVHFAAFAKNKSLREKQMGYIFEYALKENMIGNYVVIGGDFNHEFGKDPSVLDSYVKLGWQLIYPDEGTHRSCETKYDENCKLSTIDGFLCSTNIKVKKIKSLLDFSASDHSPVILDIELKDE